MSKQIKLGTCESEIFVQIESRIESAALQFEFESNQGIVVYV